MRKGEARRRDTHAHTRRVASRATHRQMKLHKREEGLRRGPSLDLRRRMRSTSSAAELVQSSAAKREHTQNRFQNGCGDKKKV